MTNKNSSKMEVPQAKEAMNRFKMEVANEIGVNLKDGYNGDLTSREAGSIGGEMVRVFITNHFSALLSVLFFNLHQIYTKYTVLHSNILFHFFRNIIWFLVSIHI